MKKIATDFEAANPGANSDDRHAAASTSTRRRCASLPAPTRVPTSISAGPASASAASMSRRVSALPLDKYYTEYKWTDELVPSAAVLRRPLSGRQARRALHLQGRGGLLQQEAAFEKAGITEEPKTYDELLAAAEKLKAAGIPAFTFGGTVNWHVMRLMDVHPRNQMRRREARRS